MVYLNGTSKATIDEKRRLVGGQWVSPNDRRRIINRDREILAIHEFWLYNKGHANRKTEYYISLEERF